MAIIKIKDRLNESATSLPDVENSYSRLNHIYNVYDKVKKVVNVDMCVAGGCLRDAVRFPHIKPKDIDIFIFNPHKDEKLVSTVCSKLYDNFEVYPLSVGFYFDEKLKKETDNGVKLAEINVDDTLVQIINTTHANIDELIQSFDWNICMYGYQKERNLVKMCKNSNEIALNKITSKAISTLRRGFIFSDRYKLKINEKDLKQLIEMSHNDYVTEDFTQI